MKLNSCAILNFLELLKWQLKKGQSWLFYMEDPYSSFFVCICRKKWARSKRNKSLGFARHAHISWMSSRFSGLQGIALGMWNTPSGEMGSYAWSHLLCDFVTFFCAGDFRIVEAPIVGNQNRLSLIRPCDFSQCWKKIQPASQIVLYFGDVWRA